jgi:hypothetical protein
MNHISAIIIVIFLVFVLVQIYRKYKTNQGSYQSGDYFLMFLTLISSIVVIGIIIFYFYLNK